MTEFTPLEAPVQDVTALPVMHPGRPVGRDDALKEIYGHLQSRQAVLVHGVAGIGKTTIAAALAAAFINQPGGVLWLNSGTHPFPELLVRVARALELDEVSRSEQPTARVGQVATALTQRKPFIVMDNVTDALAPRQFIEKCAETLPLILLSESDLEGPWETVHLDVLADLDALNLFKQKSGIRDDAQDIDIYGITKQVGYHPYPIVMAARGMVAAKQTPADYFKNLKQIQTQADNPTAAVIALSYRALNNALQGLLLMLGATFTGSGSTAFLTAVSGVPANGIEQAMTILAQLYLVEKYTRYGQTNYRLHPAVYAFARAALEGKNQLTTLQQKVHDATLTYAHQYSTEQTSHTALAQEMDNIIAAAMWAAENGNRDTANQLVGILTSADDFIQERGYVYELLQLRNVASGSSRAFPAYEPEEATSELDEPDEFYSYDDDDLDPTMVDDADEMLSLEMDDYLEDNAAYEAVSLDDLDVQEGMSSDALRDDSLQGIDIDQLRQALAQAKQQDDIARQQQILQAIGKVQVGQEKETEAIATYNELLESYDQQDDTDGALDTLLMLAALEVKTGNSQAAIMHAKRGIGIAQTYDEHATHLQLQLTLGEARQELGETGAAIEAFDKALEVARRTDDKQYEAIALYHLGEAALDNGDTDDAIHNLTQARDLFRDQNKRQYEGRVLSGLGSANAELERWSEASGYYQSAVHIAREVGNRYDEMVNLSNLGQAQVQGNKLPDALLSYRQALYIAYQRDKREEIVSAIVDLVRLMLKSNRLLEICNLLIQDAVQREPEDRDVLDLVAQVNQQKITAAANDVPQAPVSGTAQDYAANAYQLLED
jgi:tetratricopeptide (TPR) repeat protein/energy-coupling factor transporter ATP-binding protein EcfA2